MKRTIVRQRLYCIMVSCVILSAGCTNDEILQDGIVYPGSEEYISDVSQTRSGETADWESLDGIGGWNLVSGPIVSVNPGMHYTGKSSGGMYRAHEYQLREGAPMPSINYRIEFNPEFIANAVKYWSRAELLDTRKEVTSNIPGFDYGNAISRRIGSVATYNPYDISWGSGADKVYRAKFNHKLWVLGYKNYSPFPHDRPPVLLYANEVITNPEPDEPNTQLLHTYQVRITTYAVFRNSNVQMDTVVSTKTFIPKVNWRN